MFVWWFIGSIGCLFVGIVHCQEDDVKLADLDGHSDNIKNKHSLLDTRSDTVVNDTNKPAANEGIVTKTDSTTPEPFSCYNCTNCDPKSDLVSHVCEAGVTMCYIMNKRISNTSRSIRRGCLSSKYCTRPDSDDQSDSMESITCCTSHKCNEATQFKPLLFLATLSLFTILSIIINT